MSCGWGSVPHNCIHASAMFDRLSVAADSERDSIASGKHGRQFGQIEVSAR